MGKKKRAPAFDSRQLSFWILEFRDQVESHRDRSSLTEEIACLEWELEHSHRDLRKTMRQLQKRLRAVRGVLDEIQAQLNSFTEKREKETISR